MYRTSCSSGTVGRPEQRPPGGPANDTTHALPPLAALDPRLGYPDGAVCPLRPAHSSSGLAREFTSATLETWGLPELADDATVVVSELVTNAVRHALPTSPEQAGEHPLKLTLARNHRFLVCVVTDPSSGQPAVRTPDDACENGRGLHVIEALTKVWGWTPLPRGGKAVWAAFMLG